MRILHISDTHNQHRLLHDLPAADLIIHSGDITFSGTGKEVVDFVDWFGGLDYRHKIFIAGNHDDCLYGKKTETIQRFLSAGCHYLCHSGIEIEGLKFWGEPFFWSDDENGRFPKIMAQIPDGIDILISHRPPYGILDTRKNISYGCPDLLLAVLLKVSPRYHLFGHVHDAYGIQKVGATTFVNASVLDDAYQLTNEPVVFEV